MSREFFSFKHNCTTTQPIFEYIKEKIIEAIDSKILIYNKYVHDCLCIAPGNQINNICKAINNFHPRLKFAIENVINNSPNFLDLTSIKHCNKIDTIWYTKNSILVDIKFIYLIIQYHKRK